MNSQKVTKATVTLKDVTDGYLVKVLDKIESELENKTYLECYPHRAEKLNKRCKKVKQEINRRIKQLKNTRRDFVIRWLTQIEIEKIEPLEEE